MPIEIKELHISVTVDAGGTPTATNTAAAAGNSPTSAQQDERQALIAECVEQVLQILEQKRER